MKVSFGYKADADLIYHLLAHMTVNNASNLFNQEYVDRLEAARKSRLELPSNTVDYYNDNFEKLGIINFLPFLSEDYVDLKRLIIAHKAFTDTDRERFIFPFLDFADKEAPFYFTYRKALFDSIETERINVECVLSERLGKYEHFFRLFNKALYAGLSFSITRNGRGFSGREGYFSAFVPFPMKTGETDNAFFTLLHEYTHQVTDVLLKTDINMDDGSHGLSENAVILFDYKLITALNREDSNPYLRWLAGLSGKTGDISESMFLSVFTVPDNVEAELDRIIAEIFR